MELGAKIAFIKESKHVPQIGSFTMFEMPTGNSRQRSRRGQGLVQAPHLAAKELRANGSSMAVAATRSFRKPDIAIFPIPDGW